VSRRWPMWLGRRTSWRTWVIANRRYADLFEWGQRSVPLSLAAEIQHRLLPGSFTCEAGQFTLAAWLQPAGEVGGDTSIFRWSETRCMCR
jgi:glycine cleavage system aminomethyltransferase T